MAPLLSKVLLALLLPLLLGGGGPAARGPAVTDDPHAPDGAPGLGARSRPEDILERLRQPSAEDEALLGGLLGLAGAVGIHEATLRNLYRERGLFALLEPLQEPTLEALHARVDLFLEDPGLTLANDPEHRETWARVLLDPRFRVREELLAHWHAHAETLARGLRLLRAHHDGWVELADEEVTNIAVRVDLAAARLRALVHDLGALQEDPRSEGEVSAAAVAGLAPLLDLPGPERRARLAEVDLGVREVMARLRGILAGTRLESRTAETVQWLAAADQRASERLASALRWDPDTPEGEAASPAIARMKRTDRRRRAYAEALGGLRDAPLDLELAWRAARLATFVGSRFEALAHHDRFLALRGIRLHEGATWNQRVLDPREEAALLYLQQEGGDPLSPFR